MTKLLPILITLVCSVEAARILCIFPVPFHSHQVVFDILTKALANQGHELVVLAPVSEDEKIPNVTIIDVKNISYALWDEHYNKNSVKLNTITVDPATFWNLVYHAMIPILDEQLYTPEMQRLIADKKENFDLILVEGCIRSGLIVNARFKAPVIMVSSFYGIADNYYTVGAAVDPVIFPDFNMPASWNSSLWDKLFSVYTSAKLRFMEWELENVENEMIKKHFGEDAPTMAELRKNIQMLLLNVHQVWDYNRPVPPNVIYLGALHLKKPQPLEGELKNYLDNSNNGVIYMSLGSKLRSSDLPQKTVNVILKTFSSLPYDIIWKWDADVEPKDAPKNVRFEKWLPQNNMLYHRNIKAFITHAGLQSTDEAISARVPLIGLPVRSDQPTNAAKYVQHGIGITLNIDALIEEEFKQAIIDVAENSRYRENIEQLALVMEQERAGQLDKALRWIQHIARHGAQQLRPPLPNLSFAQYYMLDVIAAALILMAAIAACALFVVQCFLRKMNRLLRTNYKFKKC